MPMLAKRFKGKLKQQKECDFLEVNHHQQRAEGQKDGDNGQITTQKPKFEP